MLRKLLIILLIVTLPKAFTDGSGERIVIDIRSNENRSDLIYTRQFEASSKSSSEITLQGLDQPFLSYVVVQVHSFYFNVTLSLDKNISRTYHQNGTNLGLFVTPGNYSRTLYLLNEHLDEVQCMIAVVVYNQSAPIVGGCWVDIIDELPHPQVSITEQGYFLLLRTPKAASSDEWKEGKQISCKDNASEQLQYFTYFTYLEPLNFHHEIYFDGIKSLLFGDVINNGYQAKQVHSPYERYFEKSPGTGIIFNSVVVDAHGQRAFYVPTVSYSCPANTWNSHCSDINVTKRALCLILVVYAVLLIINLMMPQFVESALNGMLMGAFTMLFWLTYRHTTISSLDIFMAAIFNGLLWSAFFGIISRYVCIGRYLTKFTFSNLVMAIVMEIFFEDISSVYIQFGGAFILSICLFFINVSFKVYLGGFFLIMSLSHLLQVGNIHLFLVNNFHALITRNPATMMNESMWSLLRYNFINYKIELNILDWALVIFYLVGATVFTLRKEIYLLQNPDMLNSDGSYCENGDTDQFNRGVAKKRCQNCVVGIKSRGRLKLVSRCRRHHYRSNVIHERSPLISHWIATDESEDEVFESPVANSRFLRTLSSESRERLEAIQKFEV